MKINSAVFVKGVVGPDNDLEGGKDQFAFIGRSNVGKSSVINYLTSKKDLAVTSSFPGRTQQINLFLINNAFYLIDLPGYGYAKVPAQIRAKIKELINWYFFVSTCEQNRVFLIIDAEIGLTKDDEYILGRFEEYGKNVVIIANKIDKVKKSEYKTKMDIITKLVGDHKIIPFSTKKKVGLHELLEELKR